MDKYWYWRILFENNNNNNNDRRKLLKKKKRIIIIRFHEPVNRVADRVTSGRTFRTRGAGGGEGDGRLEIARICEVVSRFQRRHRNPFCQLSTCHCAK